jgi:hypothetical protein
MPATGCDTGHADILPSAGIGERCDSIATCLCGIHLSGSNMNLVGCHVLDVEAPHGETSLGNGQAVLYSCLQLLPGQMGRDAALVLGRQTVQLCLGYGCNSSRKRGQNGMEHRDLSSITHIGIDEISRKKGQVYLTNVYDLRSKNLIWSGVERAKDALRNFFQLPRARADKQTPGHLLRYVEALCRGDQGMRAAGNPCL